MQENDRYHVVREGKGFPATRMTPVVNISSPCILQIVLTETICVVI